MFSITGLLIVCLMYSAHGAPDTQIVGGTDAPEGLYPYQVSLKTPYTRSHFCGGVIVDGRRHRYVITAAHCLINREPSDIHVDVGGIRLYYPEKTYDAKTLIVHPNYKPANQMLNHNSVNDIGLIEITKDFSFTQKVKAIDLISNNPQFDNYNLTVTGWGRLEKDGPIAEILKQLTVKGYNQTMCAYKYANITAGHICTIKAHGEGTCNGDSGGPLTYQGKLVGVVSYGLPCARGEPDVFTRVYHYKDWIDKYVNAGSNQQLNIILGLFLAYLSVHSFL